MPCIKRSLAVQVLQGQFWQPMGEHGELCGWQPHIPLNMLIDALAAVPARQHAGRHGSLVAGCLQQLALSIADAAASGGARLLLGLQETMK